MDKWKIMVVEDDAPVRHLITVSLSAEDYTVIAAGTAAEAVQLAAADLQRQFIQGRKLPIHLGQILDIQHYLALPSSDRPGL